MSILEELYSTKLERSQQVCHQVHMAGISGMSARRNQSCFFVVSKLYLLRKWVGVIVALQRQVMCSW